MASSRPTVPAPDAAAPEMVRDCSVSFRQANLYMLALAVPLTTLLAAGFALGWGWRILGQGFDRFLTPWIFLPVFAAGIVVHELIHGISWMVAARLPWPEIRFGFDIKSFTPYAHAKRPIPVRAYRIGTFMPGLLTGLLPCAVATAVGSGLLMAAGLLFTFAASGDLLVLWLIRDLRPNEIVQDHPTRAGCFVVAPGACSRTRQSGHDAIHVKELMEAINDDP